MDFKRVKGFFDLLPQDVKKYFLMEATARKIFSKYSFSEIRTPVLEHAGLYMRSIGEETDIVQKEMYVFPDKKGRALCLRPEATAGVVRAYIDNRLFENRKIIRLFSIGPMFRYERPQKGRYRQFHQINVECFGASSYATDAELIMMLMDFLNHLNINGVELHINSLGCEKCKEKYILDLKLFLEKVPSSSLCEDCKRRKIKNPLRIFDCKRQQCQSVIEDAPFIIDYLCDGCRTHFDGVLYLLEKNEVKFNINKRLVRGLDYYTRTIFEVVSTQIGSQSAISGGGRYDYLVKMLGGPDTPAIGFACGMERLALLMEQPEDEKIHAYIAILSPIGIEMGIRLGKALREEGLRVELDAEKRSVKSFLREANRIKAKVSVLIGDDEAKGNFFSVKNMKTGDQFKVNFDEAIKLIKEVGYDRNKGN